MDACDAILVDDYILNLDYWVSKGGIAVKFSDSNITNKQITTGNSKIDLNSNNIDIKDSSSFESKSVKISDKSSLFFI